LKKLAYLIIYFFLFFCCSSQKAEWQGTIEEVNGVTLVKNPGQPLYGNDVYTIKEELEFGGEGGDEDFFFSLFSLKDTK